VSQGTYLASVTYTKEDLKAIVIRTLESPDETNEVGPFGKLDPKKINCSIHYSKNKLRVTVFQED
jgi:hypothetical protein